MNGDPLSSFTSIGLIAHHFEVCEFYLSEIFQHLCESRNDTPFKIFGMLVSSDMRLSMTRVAIGECLPRPSALKNKLLALLHEFKECQTLRNRAIHSANMPAFSRSTVEFHHRPLWHQTRRYESGALKDNVKMTVEHLREAAQRLTILATEMKSFIPELGKFIAKRRSRQSAKCKRKR